MEEKVESFRVLLASVTNLLYPVDIDLMHFLFSKYGTVEKIVTFSKSPTMYQALVQFVYSEQSKAAMHHLHNRNIYDGCNTLQIQPSHLPEIVVKQNSSKSWDYTLSAGPAGGGNMPTNYQGGGGGPGLLNTPGNSAVPNNNFGPGPVGAYGGGHGGQMGGYGGGGVPMRGLGSNVLGMMDKLPKELRDLNLENNSQQTPVIIVYNLTAENINVQKLFNLFSLYGTVFRIKILREKSDTALIQYSDPLYATLAHHFLQGAAMNREIQISFSKNQEVKLPPAISNQPETEEDAKRTKAFTMKDQRYGQQGDDIEKYVKGACRPTQTLFVANINDDCTQEDLTKLFSEYGTVMKFQFKPAKEGSRTQMGIIEMSCDLEAINALMNLHNHSLNGRNIKVAFTKTVIA